MKITGPSCNNLPFAALNSLAKLDRDISANDLVAGYNLAAMYRPLPQWHLAATYRSRIDLGLAGDASLIALAGPFPVGAYQGGGKFPITVPAVLSLATSYSVASLTVEIAGSRTFWSQIRELDFHYDQFFPGTVFDAFDLPVNNDEISHNFIERIQDRGMERL